MAGFESSDCRSTKQLNLDKQSNSCEQVRELPTGFDRCLASKQALRTIVALVVGNLLLIAAALPTNLWDAIMQAEIPSRVAPGLVILRSCLAIEGLIFLWLAISKWRWTDRKGETGSVSPGLDSFAHWQLAVQDRLCDNTDLTKKQAVVSVIAITLIAAGLRMWCLNTGLWLDEATPLLVYRDSSVLTLLTTYLSTNNHLLYTILEKWFISGLGEAEWVVRLPAVMFGIATVPVMYLLSRLVLTRYASVAATLLLATSFHAIYFSQNARAYSGYLFCSMAATLFLIRGLKRNRISDWIFYSLLMFVDIALLGGPTLAVFASQIVISAFVLYSADSRGFPVPALCRRICCVFAITTLLGLHLYSIILPQVFTVTGTTYHAASAGFSLFSIEFVQETIRGLMAGFSAPMLVAIFPATIIFSLGLMSLWRRSWILICSLLLPQVLLAAVMVACHLVVSPRFFILALPLGILVVVAGVQIVCQRLERVTGINNLARTLLPALVGLLVIATTPSLIRYYRLPKQDFKGAIAYIGAIRQKNQVVMPIYTAEGGFEYYAGRVGWVSQRDYYPVRTTERFETVLREHGAENILVLTTFSRALHMDHPELEKLVQAGWAVEKAFPGTIGDGTICVWKPKLLSSVR